LVAVYPETEGLTSKWFKLKIVNCLLLVNLEDPLPKSIKKYLLSALNNIYQIIGNHRKARKIRFAELFYISLHKNLEWSGK
jgi:hypothetical protein